MRSPMLGVTVAERYGTSLTAIDLGGCIWISSTVISYL